MVNLSSALTGYVYLRDNVCKVYVKIDNICKMLEDLLNRYYSFIGSSHSSSVVSKSGLAESKKLF